MFMKFLWAEEGQNIDMYNLYLVTLIAVLQNRKKELF